MMEHELEDYERGSQEEYAACLEIAIEALIALGVAEPVAHFFATAFWEQAQSWHEDFVEGTQDE